MQDAFLLQKIEFLQIELTQATERELQLKQLNQSLFAALDKSQSNFLLVRPKQNQTLHELRKTNEQLQKQVDALTERLEETRDSLETEVLRYSVQNKELALALKHQQFENNTPHEPMASSHETYLIKKENRALRQQNKHFQVKIKHLTLKLEEANNKKGPSEPTPFGKPTETMFTSVNKSQAITARRGQPLAELKSSWADNEWNKRNVTRPQYRSEYASSPIRHVRRSATPMQFSIDSRY